MSFSNRFSEARRVAGLTQRALADSLGVSFQAVQKWEGGKSQPRGKRLESICRLLGVSVQWLLTGESQKHPAIDQTHWDGIDICESEIGRKVSDALDGMRDIVRALDGDSRREFNRLVGQVQDAIKPIVQINKPASIGSRIRSTMERLAIHPEDLELLTGEAIRCEDIEQWIEGRAEPSVEQLATIAPHLGMPADYFRIGISSVTQPGGRDRVVIDADAHPAMSLMDAATPTSIMFIEQVLAASASGILSDEQIAAAQTLMNLRNDVAHGHINANEPPSQALAAEIEAAVAGLEQAEGVKLGPQARQALILEIVAEKERQLMQQAAQSGQTSRK